MRVLVVEDSARLLEAVVRGFRANGLSVDPTADGKSALEYLARYSYDVLILDLNLPRVTGLEVLRALRSGSSNTRVLVLSARDRVEDRVGALHLGADDYLTKPFAFEELQAMRRRVRCCSFISPPAVLSRACRTPLEQKRGLRA